jgi:hypothetical protein
VPASWAQNKAKADEFMARAHEYFGLSFPEILSALGVEKVADATCTMKEARARIARWLDENVYQVDEGAEEPTETPRQAALV